MKKFLAWMLGILMVLTMTACSVQEDDVIGIWQRETMYLEHYGCDADLVMVLLEDNSYVQQLFNHHTSELLNTAVGTWYISGSEVAAQEDGAPGTTYYKYNSLTDTLKNGGNRYIRLD